MNLLMCGPYRVEKYRGNYYIKPNRGKSFFANYLAAFDSVTVCFRVANVDVEPKDWELIDDPRISFLDFPDMHGLRYYFGFGGKKVERLVMDAVKKADCVISFGFGFDSKTSRLCNRLNKPYAYELVVDSAEAIRVKSPKHPIICKILAYFTFRRLRAIVKRADAVIYVNRSWLPKRYPVGKGKLSLVCSDVGLADELLCQPRVYEAPVEPLKIAFVATFTALKRHEDLIEACALLKKEGKRVEPHFIGFGDRFETMKKLAADRGLVLDKDVFFHGLIDDRDLLYSELDKCHAITLCSTTEGLSRALVEGMARGLAVLATNVGGNPELVRPEDLFEVADFNRLAEILRNMCDDPKRLTAMSKHSVETAAEYVNSKLLVKRLECYRRLADLAKNKK